jgi:hypothetical protein
MAVAFNGNVSRAPFFCCSSVSVRRARSTCFPLQIPNLTLSHPRMEREYNDLLAPGRGGGE